MSSVRTETANGYVTAVYRKAILTQLREAQAELAKLRMPSEHTEQVGVIRGLTLALCVLDHVEGGAV